MTTPTHTPERNIEQILDGYITAHGVPSGYTVYTRFSNAKRVEPLIEILCKTAEQADKGQSGNYWCGIELKIRTHYEPGTDATAHDAAVGAVADMFLREPIALLADIATTNTTITGHIICIDPEQPRSNEIEDHSNTTFVNLRFLFMPGV